MVSATSHMNKKMRSLLYQTPWPSEDYGCDLDLGRNGKNPDKRKKKKQLIKSYLFIAGDPKIQIKCYYRR